jgi:hypothetical protein
MKHETQSNSEAGAPVDSDDRRASTERDRRKVLTVPQWRLLLTTLFSPGHQVSRKEQRTLRILRLHGLVIESHGTKDNLTWPPTITLTQKGRRWARLAAGIKDGSEPRE